MSKIDRLNPQNSAELMELPYPLVGKLNELIDAHNEHMHEHELGHWHECAGLETHEDIAYAEPAEPPTGERSEG